MVLAITAVPPFLRYNDQYEGQQMITGSPENDSITAPGSALIV